MNIRPLGDKVVLKAIERMERTKGGIVLPDTAKEKPMEGEIVAVGEGRLLDNGTKVAPTVKVGDRVIYSKYAGSEVKLDDQEFLIISEKDILGIIE